MGQAKCWVSSHKIKTNKYCFLPAEPDHLGILGSNLGDSGKSFQWNIPVIFKDVEKFREQLKDLGNLTIKKCNLGRCEVHLCQVQSG